MNWQENRNEMQNDRSIKMTRESKELKARCAVA